MITIGLDVGGTKVLGVAVDSAAPASPLDEERVPTPDGGAGLVDALVGLADRLAARCPAHGPVTAMGVGVPGLVYRSGMLHLGPHLRHIADLPPSAAMTERTRVPVPVAKQIASTAGRGCMGQ